MAGVTCRDYILDYFIDAIDYGDMDRRYAVAPDKGKLKREGNLLLALVGVGNLEKHLHHIHALEDKYKVPRTTIFKTDQPGYLVLEADEYWKSTALHMSWYLQLIRHAANTSYSDFKKSSHSLMELSAFWGTFWDFGDLLVDVVPGEKFSSYSTRTHGVNGYYSFCHVTGMGILNNAHVDTYRKTYYYFDQLFALRKKQQQCAVSPATVS